MARANQQAQTNNTVQNENTVANLDKNVATLDKITDDGKKHKQGDVIRREAFGVIIETKF